jgi:mono/diheme cytochrome c family protein
MWPATHLFALLILLTACDRGDKSGDSGSGGVADTGATGDPCGPADVPEQTPLDLEADADCGAEVWATHCAGCHGAEGMGGDDGPPLDEHVPAHTDEELAFVIIAGAGDMPALGLGNQEVADSLAWLRARFGDYDGVGH